MYYYEITKTIYNYFKRKNHSFVIFWKPVSFFQRLLKLFHFLFWKVHRKNIRGLDNDVTRRQLEGSKRRLVEIISGISHKNTWIYCFIVEILSVEPLGRGTGDTLSSFSGRWSILCLLYSVFITEYSMNDISVLRKTRGRKPQGQQKQSFIHAFQTPTKTWSYFPEKNKSSRKLVLFKHLKV